MSIESLVCATGGADHIGFARYIEKVGVAPGNSNAASVTACFVCANMQASAVVLTTFGSRSVGNYLLLSVAVPMPRG
jgi:hypothetical protein